MSPLNNRTHPHKTLILKMPYQGLKPWYGIFNIADAYSSQFDAYLLFIVGYGVFVNAINLSYMWCDEVVFF
jgi:hypothetical protein